MKKLLAVLLLSAVSASAMAIETSLYVLIYDADSIAATDMRQQPYNISEQSILISHRATPAKRKYRKEKQEKKRKVRRAHRLG